MSSVEFSDEQAKFVRDMFGIMLEREAEFRSQITERLEQTAKLTRETVHELKALTSVVGRMDRALYGENGGENGALHRYYTTERDVEGMKAAFARIGWLFAAQFVMFVGAFLLYHFTK